MNIIELVELANIDIGVIKNDLESCDVSNIDSKYVNVAKFSNCDLGKMLSLGYGCRFDTLIGTCGNMRNAVDYITTDKYPKSLLPLSRLNKRQIDKIPKHKRRIVNFMSAVAVMLYDRISSDKDLIDSLDSNTKHIISYTTHKRSSLGTTVIVYEYNNGLNYYTKLLRVYNLMIVNDMFTLKHVNELIEYLKVDKTVSPFYGTDIYVK